MPVVGFEPMHLGHLDPTRLDDITEFVVEAFDEFVVGSEVQPQHQLAADVSHAVVHAVEGHDLFGRFLDAVGQREQREVLGGDELTIEELIADEVEPLAPVVAAGRIDQNDRHQVPFAGLDQGQRLEGLVLCAEPAGEQHHPVHFLDEHQLAGEEVLEVDQLAVAGDDRVGLLFEGEQDVGAHGPCSAAALVGSFHDAAACSGQHHPALLGHSPAEVNRLQVGGVIVRGAGAAEDTDLSLAAKGGEDLERVAQLTESTAEDLQIAAGCLVLFEPVGGLLDLVDQRRMPRQHRVVLGEHHIRFGQVGRRPSSFFRHGPL